MGVYSKQGSPNDGYIPCCCFFVNILFFSQPGMLNLTKIVHYHWSRMGKKEIQVVWSRVTLTFEVWILVKFTAHRLNVYVSYSARSSMCTLTFKWPVWPWPLSYRSGLRWLHIVSMRTTFVPSKMVIHQCIPGYSADLNDT